MTKQNSKQKMQKGQTYIVCYQLSTQRAPRLMRARYLGTDIHGDYTFSGRPEFGTTELSPRDVLAVKRDPGEGKCYANKRVG